MVFMKVRIFKLSQYFVESDLQENANYEIHMLTMFELLSTKVQKYFVLYELCRSQRFILWQIQYLPNLIRTYALLFMLDSLSSDCPTCNPPSVSNCVFQSTTFALQMFICQHIFTPIIYLHFLFESAFCHLFFIAIWLNWLSQFNAFYFRKRCNFSFSLNLQRLPPNKYNNLMHCLYLFNLPTRQRVNYQRYVGMLLVRFTTIFQLFTCLCLQSPLNIIYVSLPVKELLTQSNNTTP